jgi:hypothetical protein
MSDASDRADELVQPRVDIEGKLGFLLANNVRCPCCKQKIPKKNPHRMDKSKIRLLRDIASLNRAGHEWVKCEEGRFLVVGGKRLETSYCTGVGARRLKWFGLLDKLKPREALYRTNERGFAFLRGELSVPQIIWCRKGVVEVESEDRIFINEVGGVHLNKEYWDEYPGRQRRRPDPRSTDGVDTPFGIEEGL